MCALRAHKVDKELELTSRMARSVRVGCSAHESASFALGTMLLTMQCLVAYVGNCQALRDV